ncbi:8345_t:CDS:2 [Paraglomus occultum]|uniref:8345_t:CDS:1 n=1 Tax=Paraglomus occultum TaxID=144539 RepID=A0A9N9CTD4_9GLOM|nr:8345_t:CDS:2 [Paraglomus occultum]
METTPQPNNISSAINALDESNDDSCNDTTSNTQTERRARENTEKSITRPATPSPSHIESASPSPSPPATVVSDASSYPMKKKKNHRQEDSHCSVAPRSYSFLVIIS